MHLMVIMIAKRVVTKSIKVLTLVRLGTNELQKINRMKIIQWEAWLIKDRLVRPIAGIIVEPGYAMVIVIG